MVTRDLKRGVDDRPSRNAMRLKSLLSITEYQHPDRLHVYIDFGERIFLAFHLGDSSDILLHLLRQFATSRSIRTTPVYCSLTMHDTTGPRLSVREDLECIRLKFKQVPSRKKWDFHKSELRNFVSRKADFLTGD
jgi:hypothetical protein